MPGLRKLSLKHSPGDAMSEKSGADAVVEAKENLAETRALWPEVRRVAAGLRDLRQQNHFGEMITNLLKDDK